MFSTKILTIPEASSLSWPPYPVASWKADDDDGGGDGDDDDDVDDDHAHPLL